jgi:hypothetical protein
VVDEHRGVEGEVFPVETELEDGRSGWSSMSSGRPKWQSKVMTGEGVSEGEKWRSFRAFGLVRKRWPPAVYGHRCITICCVTPARMRELSGRSD